MLWTIFLSLFLAAASSQETDCVFDLFRESRYPNRVRFFHIFPYLFAQSFFPFLLLFFSFLSNIFLFALTHPLPFNKFFVDPPRQTTFGFPSVNYGFSGPSGFDPNEFAIRWDGQLVPEVSGPHRFVVGSDDGFRLYVNGELNCQFWAVRVFFSFLLSSFLKFPWLVFFSLASLNLVFSWRNRPSGISPRIVPK